MKEYWKTLTVFKKIKFTVTVFLFILLIIFAFQNWEREELNLVFVTINIHLTLIIAFSMMIGYTISMVSNYKTIQSKEKEIKNLKNRIRELNEKK